ncbi:hypothetical protein NFI96_025770 [Prochilodus magdalenae]|nr:hypothetical protein NFI96_025770 [Prochilodus magdalenae]
MRLQVTLALICVFFPKGITPFTQTMCSLGGQEKTIAAKDCAAALECINGSMNLGISKTTVNTQCCSTDLCNSEIPPALSGSPNGRRCYTCVNDDCTKTLNCEGIEDRCITVHGLPLQCYQCIPGLTGTCTDTQISCPDQCGSATIFTSAGGQQHVISVKDCAAAPECISGSLNLGVSKTTINTKCCSTDLCNSQTLPALSGSPNGRRCYTCVGNDCTKTVNCEGIEDRCITVHGKTCLHINTLCSPGGHQQQVSIKGCAAAPECFSGSMNLGLSKTTINTKCCSTNLCNSQTLPALSGSPNGRRCYTCVGNDCTNTLNCEGIEDRCIIVHGINMVMGYIRYPRARMYWSSEDGLRFGIIANAMSVNIPKIPLIEALKDMQSKQSERSKSETQE